MASRQRAKKFEAYMFLLFCATACCGLITAPAFGASESSYVIGVVPQRPPVAMAETWNPFTASLSVETGRKFRLKFYESMAAFEKDYAAGVPDFIFTNPAQAVAAHKRQGYLPLTRSSSTVSGILFVRKDSQIDSIDELKGAEVAFVGARNL